MHIAPITITTETALQRVLRLTIERIRERGLCREPAPHPGIGPNGEQCVLTALDSLYADRLITPDENTCAMKALLENSGSDSYLAMINVTVCQGGMPAVENLFARTIAAAA